MKRGFLNTDKAKSKLAADTDASRARKDKGKAKAESPSPTNEPRPRPPLLDLHSAPPSLSSTTKYPEHRNRFIFRHWPRDPNGKIILPSDILGKQAGNGLNLWGATLYDFYFVRRIPSNLHALTISSGSKLTNVMKSFGELEYARDEIAWASREADPKEIPAWDPAQAIVAYERRVHASSCVTTSHGSLSESGPDIDIQALQGPDTASHSTEPHKDARSVDDPSSQDSASGSSDRLHESVDAVGTKQHPSGIAVDSVFHPSHFPPPWPLVPFESPCSPFPLQHRLPIHLLPKKLYVHDPWKLLNIGMVDPDASQTQAAESWSSKTDKIHAYTLSLPPESQRMAEVTSKQAAAEEDEALKVHETVFIFPRDTQGPTEQPAIRAFLPQRPRKLTEVLEAHLYLSPRGKLGTGNHSIVYEAELELPRDLFCESTYCKSCLDEQIQIEIHLLKESGKWEQLLNEGEKDYGNSNGHDGSSHNATSSSLQTPPRHVGFVKVGLEHVPMVTVDVVAASKMGEAPAGDLPQRFARVSDPAINRHMQYEGTIVSVHPKIQWQNPSLRDTICTHQAKKMKPVPRTATFRVAAKLSLPGDPHLEREANNYLKFPTHFFQHWSGYNVIPPLHDPTPVGALVPQFFGYYTPDGRSKEQSNNGYWSPILLLEHCGKPIRVGKLPADDRHECAALLFRFHCAGWLHESFAERNILMQKRHPTCSPLEDEEECEIPHRHRPRSFRLIDFGRSVESNSWNAATEEMKGKELFGLL